MTKRDELKQQLSEVEYEIYSMHYILDKTINIANNVEKEIKIKIAQLEKEKDLLKKELRKFPV